MSHICPKPILAAAVLIVSIGIAGSASAQRRGGNVDAAALGKTLRGADVTQAVAAAASLGSARNGKAAVDALLDALAVGLPPQVARGALDALAAHADPRGFETLQVYLHHRNASVRAAAVGALAALADERVEPLILAALRDGTESVRAVAIGAVAERSIKRAVPTLLELLKKGDEATAPALARLGDVELARALGELIGKAPDDVLASAIGGILRKPKFGPEEARVQVVRTLGKVPGTASVEQLSSYIDSVPENPPRQSRREAEAIIEQRLTGGN